MAIAVPSPKLLDILIANIDSQSSCVCVSADFGDIYRGKKEYDGTFSQKITKGRVEICPLLSKIQGCFTLAIIVHQALT